MSVKRTSTFHAMPALVLVVAFGTTQTAMTSIPAVMSVMVMTPVIRTWTFEWAVDYLENISKFFLL